jgi:hypothetical protein
MFAFHGGRWMLFIFIYSVISFTHSSEVTFITSKTEKLIVEVTSGTLKILTQPLHGNVEIESNKLIYIPQNMLQPGPHFSGKVHFSYTTESTSTTLTHVTVHVTNQKPGESVLFKFF